MSKMPYPAVGASDAPKVSIAMPVYNGGPYFELALQSALAQTYSNIEIVIVDDGSTDGGATAAVARRYAEAHPGKVRFFQQKNTGVAGALNLAIKEMTGEFFCWLSHDDIFLPDKTSRQIAFFQTLGRSDVFLCSDYGLIDSAGEKVTDVRLDHAAFIKGPLLPLYRGSINGCTICIPMFMLRSIGGPFDTKYRYTQDYWLWLKLLESYECLHIPELLVDYRIHSGQDSHKPAAIDEGEALWAYMIDSLTEIQRVQMYGSSWKFYDEIYKIISSSPYLKAAECLNKLRDSYNKNALISVVIPFFNEIDLVKRAVASVFSQTHKNLEIILVNDGSTDSVSHLEEWIKRDRRIQLFHQSNQGVASARNLGMAIARGSYIAFLDADDVFLPEKLAVQLEKMSRGGFLVSHTSYYVSFPARRVDLGFINSGAKSGIIYPAILESCPIAPPTVMLHRSVVSAGLSFPAGIHMSEDALFLAEISFRHEILGIVDPLTIVEWSEGTAAISVSKAAQGLTQLINTFSSHHTFGKSHVEIEQLKLSLAHIQRLKQSGVEEIPGMEAYAFNGEGTPDMNTFAFSPALAQAWAGDLEGAADHMMEILATYPEADNVRYWCGSCLAFMGRASEADAVFAKPSRLILGNDEFASTKIIRCGPISRKTGPIVSFFGADVRDFEGRTVYMVSADDGYFSKFGIESLYSVALSNPNLGLHVHLINPSHDTMAVLEKIRAALLVPLSWSRIEFPLKAATISGERAFYSAARFISAPDIIDHFDRPLLIGDIDQLVIGDISDLLSSMDDIDIGIMKFETQSANIFSLVSASVFFANPTAKARSFLQEVRDYLVDTCNPWGEGMWHVDQAALATRMLRRPDVNFGNISPSLMQSTDMGLTEMLENVDPNVLFWSITASIKANGLKLNHPLFKRISEKARAAVTNVDA